ncbi:membrane-associated protein [Nocardioides terrae]|uniref:Membrane-associated protein n=1 Tax=Nocardioides terrae TaxID=574651 RepID=A0A1I1EQN6_9ACTN|nr:DedA family protein [Nocardioides terrae]SFB89424.1 membrane-associated protein [Nocardioides terrae]
MLLDLIQPLLLGMKWMDPDWLLSTFGSALFWLSLAIIFVECGLFFPFLPGDTLLFAMGLFIGTDRVDIVPGGHGVDLVVALLLFVAAAFAGNVAGYEIGRRIGPRIYEHDGRLLKRKYLEQTSTFFDEHGSKALVIGRFVPFVRTFITLVAGVTRMDRTKFFVWSAVGAALWTASITLLGYFLGRSVPWLGDNIDYVTIGLLLLTVVPIAIELRRRKKRERHAKRQPQQVP